MLDLFRTLPFLAREIEDAAPLREAIVFAAWRRTAGEALTSHAAPVRLQNATLTIAVSNRTWQAHLKDLASQMVFKLNSLLGASTVKYIEFEIDESAVLRSRQSQDGVDESELRRLAEHEITPELEQAAAKIEDEELRKQFLAAAGNCLVRRTRKESRL
jgi:hypothetical protein